MPHHSIIKHRGQGRHEARTRHARRYKWVTIGSRPFDFLGVGGRVISKKNIMSWRLIPREKILARKYLAKKTDTENNLSWGTMLEKKSYTVLVRKKFYHQRFGKKKRILTQTKSPILPPPPSKLSQIVGPLWRSPSTMKDHVSQFFKVINWVFLGFFLVAVFFVL